MAFCASCGAQLADGSRFCVQCGTPVFAAGAQGNEQRQNYQANYQPQQPPKQAPVAPSKDAADFRALTALSYLSIIFMFIALILAPKSAYVRKHANQVIALIIWFFACGVVMIVPFLGWLAGGAGMVAGVVFMIICICRACKYDIYQIPIFGAWRIIPEITEETADA